MKKRIVSLILILIFLFVLCAAVVIAQEEPATWEELDPDISVEDFEKWLQDQTLGDFDPDGIKEEYHDKKIGELPDYEIPEEYKREIEEPEYDESDLGWDIEWPETPEGDLVSGYGLWRALREEPKIDTLLFYLETAGIDKAFSGVNTVLEMFDLNFTLYPSDEQGALVSKDEYCNYRGYLERRGLSKQDIEVLMLLINESEKYLAMAKGNPMPLGEAIWDYFQQITKVAEKEPEPEVELEWVTADEPEPEPDPDTCLVEDCDRSPFMDSEYCMRHRRESDKPSQEAERDTDREISRDTNRGKPRDTRHDTDDDIFFGACPGCGAASFAPCRPNCNR